MNKLVHIINFQLLKLISKIYNTIIVLPKACTLYVLKKKIYLQNLVLTKQQFIYTSLLIGFST